MIDNFFLDNPDLQFRLEQLDLREVLELKERNYAEAGQYPTAPRHYADAKDNYRMILEVLGELCATRVAPRAAEADEEGVHFANGQVEYAKATRDAIEALRQAELFGSMLPRKYGGLFLPESVYQMMVEIVSRAESGLMTIFGLQEIASSIEEYGSEEAKQRVLPKFSRGEVSGAMILTEADAGSDLGGVQTRAVYDEAAKVWRLTGVKRFITNGNADVALVLARSEEGSHDGRGLSLFLVERDPSVKIRRIENKMGLHASPTCELQYTNTPAELIGKRRFGLLRYSMALMNGARLAVAAQALGIAEAAYREADKYSRQRIQFGKPIRELQPVARMLVAMRGEIEATRALLGETGRWVDLLKAYERAAAEGTPADPDTARERLKTTSTMSETLTPIVKYYSTEMGNRVCFQAVQIHGGVGYMREFQVERLMRDQRVTNIYEGTSQLQVVAATGKLLGHSLDPLLHAWMDLAVDSDLAGEKAALEESTGQFQKAVDHLKGQDRAVIDFYAGDLVDMAAWIICSWLILRDAQILPHKKDLFRAYLADVLPKIRVAGEVVMKSSTAVLDAKKTLLG
ncbi:MAG: acyl-CoA dehydrogenase family protein [Anaerolineales bacterium]|nr:acyl-CoA dehydrogenase family protein [Anaerolineales bacterium]